MVRAHHHGKRAQGIAISTRKKDAALRPVDIWLRSLVRSVNLHRDPVHKAMEIREMTKVITLTLGIATFAHGAATTRPAIVTLADLTSTAGLPPGCTLIQSRLEPLTIGLTVPNIRVPSNPWIGSERSLVAAVREAIYGAPRVPDTPLMTTSTLREFFLHLADGVEEAYVSVYERSGFNRVFIYGLRFAVGSKLPPRPIGPATPPILTWIESDRIVAVVQGDADKCSQALASHVKALGDQHP